MVASVLNSDRAVELMAPPPAPRKPPIGFVSPKEK